jgi:nucleotide-binding universal stress UspA family protein
LFSRIILSLDGSEVSEQAVPITISLANALSLPVTLVEVVYQYSASTGTSSQVLPIPGIYLRLENEARDHLGKIATRIREQGVESVQEIMRRGDAAAEIIAEADQGQADLIVMATHGRSGVSRWTLGSVCDRVVRHSESPVLAIRAQGDEAGGPPAGDISRIVVPLDGSGLGEQILPPVTDLARALNVPVALIRVGEMADLYEGYWPDDADEARKLDEAATAYLTHHVARLSALGVESVESTVLHGRNAEKILSFAAEQAGTLVAMTTHGRSGISRWALGGVADRVIRHHSGYTMVLKALPVEEPEEVEI